MATTTPQSSLHDLPAVVFDRNEAKVAPNDRTIAPCQREVFDADRLLGDHNLLASGPSDRSCFWSKDLLKGAPNEIFGLIEVHQAGDHVIGVQDPVSIEHGHAGRCAVENRTVLSIIVSTPSPHDGQQGDTDNREHVCRPFH